VRKTVACEKCTQQSREKTVKIAPTFLMHLKYKLCDSLGVQLPRPVKQRIFKYRLDEGMSKMKHKNPMESVELIRIKKEADLESLRLVLGMTICYGLHKDAPKLNCPATMISENDTLNIVVASTEAPDA
jgi:hypothetical protein